MSRLSAHLHFGMVSPFRVARDALAAKSFGAGKFVDEYLTWREVAYAFCFYHSADLDTLKARSCSGRVSVFGRCAACINLLAIRHIEELSDCAPPSSAAQFLACGD